MPVALSLREESLKDSTISIGENYTVFYFDNFNLREKASGIFHLVMSAACATIINSENR